MAHARPVSLAEQPILQVSPAGPVYCIDVECAATGTGHNDREMIQIGLVDAAENVLCNLYVTPESAVVSYLTPLTGEGEKSWTAPPPTHPPSLPSLPPPLSFLEHHVR